MANVDVYRDSLLTAQDVLDFGCDHAVIATGARWTREMLGADGDQAPAFDGDAIYTPDEILAGTEPAGPVVIYDFDHYYMGGCLAELLRRRGLDVTIVTLANAVSAWTFMNNELVRIRERMIELGVRIVTEHRVTDFRDGTLELSSIYRGSEIAHRECGSLVVVGIRARNDALFQELNAAPDRIADASIASVRCIGDCRAPGAIVHAVYSGHECARTIEAGETVQLTAWERARL